MSTNIRYAVTVERLLRFPEFQSAVHALPASTVVYVQNDFVVTAGPARDSSPIFKHISDTWVEFCKTELLGSEKKEERSYCGTVQPHKWNTCFKWRTLSGPFRFITEEQANFYDDHGWVVIENAVSPSTVERLIEESDYIERGREAALKGMTGGRAFIARADEITFTTHMVKQSPFIRDFYSSQLFRDLGHDFLGPNVRLYWDQAVYKKPGVSAPFPWHQDNGYTFVEPQQYITCWIALNDADETNGCMWFTPGVHKLGTIEHTLTPLGYTCFSSDPSEALPVATRAGTVIVLSALTPHKTGPNTKEDTRRALVIQYVPDGAVAITEDPWGRVSRTTANDPQRQFEILKNGKPLV